MYNIIKELCLKNNISISKLAENLGFRPSVFTELKSGRTKKLSSDKIKKIADYFSVSTDDILGYKPVSNIDRIIPVGEQCRLPVYGQVSAGNGVLTEGNIIGWENADSKYNDGEHFFLVVRGDSMSPKIDDGDLILVRKQTSVDSGTIGVFIVEDSDGFVKKVDYTENHISLISVNPYYPPLEFDGADVLKVIVVGKVIELKRKFE